jgi:hypothetical protein
MASKLSSTMRRPFEPTRAHLPAGFSLVETLLALGLAAGGLTLGATALSALVAQVRQRDEAGAAGVALLTVEAELKTRDISGEVAKPPRWWIDRTGQRILGREEEPPRGRAGEAATFFEVEWVACAPDGSEMPAWAGVVQRVAIRISWPVVDSRSRRVAGEHRSSRVSLLAVRP